MDQIETSEHYSSKQEVLKQRLFAGELEPEVFLNELSTLDQSTPTHDAATRNLAALSDENVRSFFMTLYLHDRYFNLLSLTNFHIGQQKIVQAMPDAFRSFENALLSANRIENVEYVPWKMYVEGTLAYLKEDIGALRKITAAVEGDVNKAVLTRLLRGLEERGGVDYVADYTGVRNL